MGLRSSPALHAWHKGPSPLAAIQEQTRQNSKSGKTISVRRPVIAMQAGAAVAIGAHGATAALVIDGHGGVTW
jgi:hypothetical protein